jgi:hypothetical protein
MPAILALEFFELASLEKRRMMLFIFGQNPEMNNLSFLLAQAQKSRARIAVQMHNT